MGNKLSVIKNYFLLLFFSYLSYLLIFKTNYSIPILGNADFLIHEAGHLVFLPFGGTLQLLGGTILQISVPIMFLIYFAGRIDKLGLTFSMFWLGENLINISQYISDAKAQMLPIIGGGHDWFILLSKFHKLEYATGIGKVVFYLGVLILIFSLLNAILKISLKPFHPPSAG